MGWERHAMCDRFTQGKVLLEGPYSGPFPRENSDRKAC
jgi:hypothetical protein